MWANFYNTQGGGPQGGPGEPGHNGVRYPGSMSPHMAPMEAAGWWAQGGVHAADPYRMGGPPVMHPGAPGPWAMRGPRPRGERRGPGRPRLTGKGGGRADNTPPGEPGTSPFYAGPDSIPDRFDMVG